MSYFPIRRAAIIAWIKNIILNLPTEAAKLNEPIADTNAIVAELQGLLTAYDAAQAAKIAARAANATMVETEKTVTKKAKSFIQRLRGNPLMTDEIQKILLIFSSSVVKDLTNFIPVITVVQTGSRIRVNFKRRNMHALNIYGRLAGETEFKLLATVTKNPWFDVRGLLKAGVTEMREFYGVAVENNEEVGKPSAIVAIAFRG